MEYLPAGSFASRIASTGPLPAAEAVAVATQVADALAAAHGTGVIHRDVKPGNLLIGHFGDAKLADFGIAALASATTSVTHTMAGTLSYMAPELLEGEAASEASDVYALGATLFTLLTGQAAFASSTDATPLAILRRVITEPVPDLTRHGIDPHLARVVERAMARDVADRTSTAAGVVDALAAVSDAQGWPRVRTYAAAVPDTEGSSSGRCPSPAPTPSPTPAGVNTPHHEPDVRTYRAEATPIPTSAPVDSAVASPGEEDETVLRPRPLQGTDDIAIAPGPSMHRTRRSLIVAVAAVAILGVAALVWTNRGGDTGRANQAADIIGYRASADQPRDYPHTGPLAG